MPANDYMYGWEKLRDAVTSLAAGADPIQDRLANAKMFSLVLIRAQNMPPALYDRLAAVIERFPETNIAPADMGTTTASARRLTDDEASVIATEIVSLFNGQCDAYYSCR